MTKTSQNLCCFCRPCQFSVFVSRTILTQCCRNPVFSFLKLLLHCRSNGFLTTLLLPLKKTVFDSFFPCFPNTIMPLSSFNYISFRSVLCEHDYCDSALKALMERAGDDSQSLIHRPALSSP